MNIEYVVMIRTDTTTAPVYTALSLSSNFIPDIDERELIIDYINEATIFICDDVIAIFTKDGVLWNTPEFEYREDVKIINKIGETR